MKLTRTTLLLTVIAGLCALAMLGVVHYVHINGRNIPFYDEWHHTAEIAAATARGDVPWGRLFEQWNEHRPMWLHLFTIIAVLTTRWNLLTVMYVHIAVAALLAGLIIALAAAHFNGADRRAGLLIVAVPIAFLVFSLRMRQIWLWSMQILWTWGFVCFFAGLVVVWLARPGWLGLAAAIFGAFGFTYSLAYGLLAWGIFPILLWFRGYRRPLHYIVFMAVAVLVAAQYFIDFDRGQFGVGGMERGLGLLNDPIRVGAFALGVLGSPLVPVRFGMTEVAIVMAVIGMIVFALNVATVWGRERSLGRVIVWVLLAGFSVGSALMIALGRAHDYPDRIPLYPLMDRYTQPMTLLWISLLVVGTMNVLAWYRARQDGLSVARGTGLLVRVDLVLLALVLGLMAVTAHQTREEQPFVLQSGEDCVRDFPVTRSIHCMRGLFIQTYVNPIERVQAINDVSAARLTIWNNAAVEVPYSAALSLVSQPFTIPRSEDDPPTFAYRIVGRWGGPALVMRATAQANFVLTVPATTANVTFRSIGVLDLSNQTIQPDMDGVLFRVAVENAEGGTVLIDEPFNPQTRTAPLRMDVSLNAYRGQTITLILQLASGANQTDDDALWLDPRMETGLQP